MMNCCLCGLPYDRIGNNPAPLSDTGCCCDACNEIVIEARMPGPSQALAEEIERVMDALEWGDGRLRDMAVAAICASRGPPLWAERQRKLAQLMKPAEGEA